MEVISEREALERAIELAGGQQALANKISTSEQKVTQQSVSWWLNETGKAPAEKVLPIEAAVNGAVTRHQLRPDIYPITNH
jgi:DNA-binding transcriptional regulator YdaS (Cro superfamily)